MTTDGALYDNAIPTGLPGGFFLYEADGDLTIRYADPNVIELYECSSMEEFRELCNNSFEGMVHPEDYAKIQNDINAQTFGMEKRHDYVRYRIITKNGKVRYIEDFGHLVHGADGMRYFYVYIVDTNKEEYFNRNRNSLAESQVLSSMHNTDRLTGIASMKSFYDDVQELLDSEDCPTELTFAHFNILHFKVFNDEYGFQAGDDLLCDLALTLHKEFQGSFLARFSNDHFAVCAPMDLDQMVEHVTNVHDIMTKVRPDTRVEVKAGIYLRDALCTQVGAACDYARLACNTIKRRYDKIYGVYDSNLYESLRLEQYVIDHVDAAVENGCLKVFYQPIVRVETGKICGYEALVRWDDPDVGFLSPKHFVPTLEEFRMIDKVDRFTVHQVFEDLAKLRDAGEPIVPVSINLSRLDFELCDVFQIVEESRNEFGVEPDMIDIEITESMLSENAIYLVETIQRFRNTGYRIWVDDFGSGYSALNSLLDYDFEVLKLDLEFLRTFDEHPRAGDLIKNVIRLAHGMGVESLQEGVEREDHLEFLRQAGCEMAQGYFFARPMPLEESRATTRAKGLEWE